MSLGCFFVNKKHAWGIFILALDSKLLISLSSISALSQIDDYALGLVHRPLLVEKCISAVENLLSTCTLHDRPEFFRHSPNRLPGSPSQRCKSPG